MPTFAQEQNTADPEVRQQIQALMMNFQEAFNSHDVAAITSLFTQDAVAIRSVATSYGGGTFSGRQALEKMFAGDFALHPRKMVNEHVQLYVMGNDVYATTDTTVEESVGEWKGHELRIYVRPHDSWEIPWKIRMLYVNE